MKSSHLSLSAQRIAFRVASLLCLGDALAAATSTHVDPFAVRWACAALALVAGLVSPFLTSPRLRP